MSATRTMSKQLFQTSNLSLQSKNRLFELYYFLLRPPLTEFRKLRFFLIIHRVCSCFLQFFLQLLNGMLIHLLSLAALNLGIGTLNKRKKIGASVDSRGGNSGLFCDRRNGDFVRLHATSKHSLNRHPNLLVMLFSHLFARLDESIRVQVLWAVTVFGTHGLLRVQTSRRAGQSLPGAATMAG